MKKNTPTLSIIIPIFNEEKRVSNLTPLILFAKEKKFLVELIVVNDGSTDKSKQSLLSFQKKYPLQIISYNKNRGKGYAIRKGMKTAKGKYRLYTDIDLSTSIKEIDKLFSQSKYADVLVATRKTSKAKVLKKQPYARELLGRLFTTFCNLFLSLHFSDFTCGLKCFSAEAADDIFAKATINRWAFDTEILYIATIQNYTIREIPIVWKNDPNTRVSFPGDIFFSLLELGILILRRITGYYSKTTRQKNTQFAK